MKKRLVSLILTTALIMTMIPASVVSAATTNESNSVIERIEFEDLEVIEESLGTMMTEYDESGNPVGTWFKYDIINPDYTIYTSDGSSLSSENFYTDDEKFTYNGVHYRLVFDVEQSYQKPLQNGTYTVKGTIKGTNISDTFDCTITDSPVTSIQIEPKEIIEESAGEWVSDSYFEYDLNKVFTDYTVVFNDGTTLKSLPSGFLRYNDQAYKPKFYTDQKPEKPWVAGNTYTAKMAVLGFEQDVELSITETGIESITFEGMSAVIGTKGQYLDHDLITGERVGSYFVYHTRNKNYVVKMKDGTTIYHDEDDDEIGFEHEGVYYSVEFKSGISYANQWDKPGKYTVKAYAPGYRGDYTFTVSPTLVEKVEIEDIEIVEDTCMDAEGVYDDDWNLLRTWKKYSIYKACKNYKVTLKDGTVIEGGEDYNLKSYYPIFWDDQREDNQWEVGKTYDAVMEIMGVKTPFKVTIKSGEKIRVKMNEDVYEMPANIYCHEDFNATDNRLCYKFEKVIAGYEVTMPDGEVISSDATDGHSVTYKGTTYYPEFILDEVIYEPWKVGETHEVVMKVLGREVSFQVTVGEGPVASIDFGELSLRERRGGEYTGTYYHYNLRELCKEYTVTLKDGTVLKSNWLGEIEYADNDFELIIHDNQDELHPWTVGVNTFEVEIMGKRFPVNVTLKHEHNWFYTIIDGETCDDPRMEYHYCSGEGCNETKYIPLPATGHDYTEADGSCIYCGKLPGEVAESTPAPDVEEPPTQPQPAPEQPQPAPEQPQPAPDADTDKPSEPAAHKHAYKKTVTKASMKKAGSIVRKCSCGDVKLKKTIAKIKSVTVKDAVYTGKALKPSVTVKDAKGKKLVRGISYTVICKNNKKIGKATVTIKFKNNYKGTITKTFKINPAKVAIKSAKAGKKSVNVKWKKATKPVTGYEVMYSTSKNFKKGEATKIKVVKSTKKTSLKIGKLQAKKKYYVKVRSYKTVKGKKYYSGWSKVMNCRSK